MRQLTIRNVSPELALALRREQRKRGCSLNQTVLDLISQALGLGPDGRYDNGLGKLAGTWNQEDLREFESNTAVFERIDEELWK